jgi:hypothetical protein
MKDVINVKEMERIHNVRWVDLAELEPELDRLLNFARMVGNGCRNWWDVERRWGQFKNEIAGLVGYFGKHRRHPTLGTVAAYDVVYWKLHNAVANDERGG